MHSEHFKRTRRIHRNKNTSEACFAHLLGDPWFPDTPLIKGAAEPVALGLIGLSLILILRLLS